MPSTERQTRFLEPDGSEKQYFKSVAEQLHKAGYHVDISNDATHRTLLYPDTLGIWYPGYYEKWFFDRMSYKEHDTYVGFEDNLGAIAISILIEPCDLKKRQVRALVRTSLGFHAFTFEIPSNEPHRRSMSTAKKVHKMNTESFLEEVLQRYIDFIRNPETGSSPTDGSKSLRRWGSIKEASFFTKLNVGAIMSNLSLAPFPHVCKALHNLEKPQQSSEFVVDVLLTGRTNGPLENWATFQKMLGKVVQDPTAKIEESASTNRSSKKTSASDDLRQSALMEIIQTEKNYVEKLRVMNEIFLQPLKEANILSKVEINGLLPRISELLKIHENMLHMMENMDTNGMNIGQIISQSIKKFEIYTHYINGFEAARKNVRKFRNEKPQFDSFLHEAQAHPRCHRCGILDLMIEPVQRIPRYPLLLERLLKAIDTDEKMFDDIDEAIAQVKKLNASLDNSQKIELSTTALFDLQRTIQDFPADIVKASRQLLEHFEVKEIDSNGKEVASGIIYLLNDSVLIVHRKTSGLGKKTTTLKFMAFHEFKHTRIISLADRGYSDSFQIKAYISRQEKHHLAQDQRLKKPSSNDDFIIHSFRTKDKELETFLSAYRNAFDDAYPSSYPDRAKVFRKWADNTKFTFCVYQNMNDYRMATSKSKFLVIYAEDAIPPLLPTDLETFPLAIGVVNASQKKMRYILSNRICLIGRLRVSMVELGEKITETDTSNETWWIRVDEGFQHYFYRKLSSVGLVIGRYDENYQIERKDEARQQLASIVHHHKGSSLSGYLSVPGSMTSSTSVQDLLYGTTQRRSSLKSPGRRNSFASKIGSSMEHVTQSLTSLLPSEETVTLFADSFFKHSSPTALPPSGKIATINGKSASRRPSILNLKLWNSDTGLHGKPDQVNVVVTSMISWMEKHCLLVDGIYKTAASQTQTDELLKRIRTLNQDAVITTTLSEFNEHAVAKALKDFIREHRDAVIDANARKHLLQLFQDSQNLEAVEAFVCSKLPTSNYNLLNLLFRHLNHVSENAQVNFVPLQTLSEIWTPILFTDGETQSATPLISYLIANVDSVFTGPTPRCELQPTTMLLPHHHSHSLSDFSKQETRFSQGQDPPTTSVSLDALDNHSPKPTRSSSRLMNHVRRLSSSFATRRRDSMDSIRKSVDLSNSLQNDVLVEGQVTMSFVGRRPGSTSRCGSIDQGFASGELHDGMGSLDSSPGFKVPRKPVKNVGEELEMKLSAHKDVKCGMKQQSVSIRHEYEENEKANETTFEELKNFAARLKMLQLSYSPQQCVTLLEEFDDLQNSVKTRLNRQQSIQRETLEQIDLWQKTLDFE